MVYYALETKLTPAMVAVLHVLACYNEGAVVVSQLIDSSKDLGHERTCIPEPYQHAIQSPDGTESYAGKGE